jgi:hypothetical protein
MIIPPDVQAILDEAKLTGNTPKPKRTRAKQVADFLLTLSGEEIEKLMRPMPRALLSDIGYSSTALCNKIAAYINEKDKADGR